MQLSLPCPCPCLAHTHTRNVSSFRAAQLQVNSFGSALNTTVWKALTSSTGSQVYRANETSASSNQLKLAITPCTSCGAYNFTAGGVITNNDLFGFGVYTASFKAPSRLGFTAQFEVRPHSLFPSFATLNIIITRIIISSLFSLSSLL
jgi:hypothetical protein